MEGSLGWLDGLWNAIAFQRRISTQAKLVQLEPQRPFKASANCQRALTHHPKLFFLAQLPVNSMREPAVAMFRLLPERPKCLAKWSSPSPLNTKSVARQEESNINIFLSLTGFYDYFPSSSAVKIPIIACFYYLLFCHPNHLDSTIYRERLFVILLSAIPPPFPPLSADNWIAIITKSDWRRLRAYSRVHLDFSTLLSSAIRIGHVLSLALLIFRVPNEWSRLFHDDHEEGKSQCDNNLLDCIDWLFDRRHECENYRVYSEKKNAHSLFRRLAWITNE